MGVQSSNALAAVVVAAAALLPLPFLLAGFSFSRRAHGPPVASRSPLPARSTDDFVAFLSGSEWLQRSLRSETALEFVVTRPRFGVDRPV